MAAHGIEAVDCYCVDNALVRLLLPARLVFELAIIAAALLGLGGMLPLPAQQAPCRLPTTGAPGGPHLGRLLPLARHRVR